MGMNREPNAPLLRRVGERRPTFPLPDLVAEHAVLARWLGQLQRRMGVLQHDHRQQVAVLKADLMRLRGQTLVLRTATFWGLSGLLLAPADRAARVPVLRAVHLAWREASEIICQTGCVGHAHPWRDDQGLCRQTGKACQPGAGAQAEPDAADWREDTQSVSELLQAGTVVLPIGNG
jgi:hypothetical protein